MKRFWRRLAEWLVMNLPEPLVQHPYELFLAGLCVMAGLPILMQVTPQPDSLQALLPSWLVLGWGTHLVGGGVLALFGIGLDKPRMDRFGMTLLTPAAVVYAVSIVVAQGTPGLLAAAITLAFGLASGLRLAVLTVISAVERSYRDTCTG